MGVTYDDSLATDRDRVRFYVGDTVEDSGPKPGDGNFTDNEIAGLVTLEGSWQKAVAACFETLHGEYAREVDVTVGPRKEALGQTAKHYAGLASQWRERYGESAARVGVRHMTRVDGYSDDEAYDEV